MGLLQRLSLDLKAGWATLRQGTAEAANRALEESELVKLRLRLRKLDDQIGHVYEDIGERAVLLYDRGEAVARIMTEHEMAQLLNQLQQLRRERAQLEAEISDIRSGA